MVMVQPCSAPIELHRLKFREQLQEVGFLKAHVHVEAVEETDGKEEQIEVTQNVLPVERA